MERFTDKQLFINSLVHTHLIKVMLIFKRENKKHIYCEILGVNNLLSIEFNRI